MTRPKPRYRPGDRIGGRYQVHSSLMGGMGEVYLCLDLQTWQHYALKTFQQRYQSHKLRQAFENEVATWVSLEKHPNIVRCFYMDILDNQPFMILEWVAEDQSKGNDLRSWLRHGPLDLRTALDFTMDICRGLIHAQGKQPGLVHRDLKPENILVAKDGLAKITDFGLAQIVENAGLEVEGGAEGRQSMVGKGGIAGTPAYMAPEQWQNDLLDIRADVYALGCVLYELVMGRTPFQATKLDDWRHLHLKADIPELTVDQNLPEALSILLTRCMAKQLEERFATVNQLMRELALVYHQEFSEFPKTVSTKNEYTVEDYNNRGVTFERLQLYEEALADYNQSIQLDPHSAKAFNNRGSTYEKMHRFDEALTNYNRALQLDPNYAKAYYNRGNVYDSLDQYDKAIADYNRAIQLDPYYSKPYANLGVLYQRLHRYNDALANYTYAIQRDPFFAQAYYNRGVTYQSLQSYDEALADFNRAIQLDATYSPAYIHRGNVYANLGSYSEALADFHRAVKLEPAVTKAYFNIGAVLTNLNMLQEALPYLEQAARLGDNEAVKHAKRLREILESQTP